MKSYSLEDKIRIIEEFKKNGGEIKGTTTYQDCPIGQWDIMIRYQVKKYQNGEKSNINPTDEQLKKLERIGVLESQIEATIDEKTKAIEKRSFSFAVITEDKKHFAKVCPLYDVYQKASQADKRIIENNVNSLTKRISGKESAEPSILEEYFF